MNNTRVFIDPTSRIYYASFYIQGLYEIYGKEQVSFSARHFRDLERSQTDFSFEHYFAFVVCAPTKPILKVVVDFCDPPDIHPTAYAWCDRYAKVNFNKKETARGYLPKIIPVPPGFGIRIWDFYKTSKTCINNYFKAKNRLKIPKKRFFRDYFQQFKRPRLSEYLSSLPQQTLRERPYIFMIASLWADKSAKGSTNLYRKKFIEAAQQSNCDFEGGFYAKDNSHDHYRKFIFTKPYTPSEYLENTKKSYLVFNTPAVHGCFGWKLAEYLAMGKAIVSTPLRNDLAHSLIDGTHIYYIDKKADFEQRLAVLLQDEKNINLLEKNARDYFNEHIAPARVINRIVQAQLPLRLT